MKLQMYAAAEQWPAESKGGVGCTGETRHSGTNSCETHGGGGCSSAE